MKRIAPVHLPRMRVQGLVIDEFSWFSSSSRSNTPPARTTQLIRRHHSDCNLE